MQYNPKTYRRRSARLQGYDYSQAGAYFVTLCVQHRKCLFGDIHNNKMRLNSLGTIITDQWYAMPERFSRLELDAFVAMPNHIHGILVLPAAKRRQRRISIGDIVGAYKSLCVYRCLQWVKRNRPNQALGKLWQRNYWEHVIRNEFQLNHIREYIHNNPAKWELDKLHIDN